jgi:hypothetical protein
MSEQRTRTEEAVVDASHRLEIQARLLVVRLGGRAACRVRSSPGHQVPPVHTNSCQRSTASRRDEHAVELCMSMSCHLVHPPDPRKGTRGHPLSSSERRRSIPRFMSTVPVQLDHSAILIVHGGGGREQDRQAATRIAAVISPMAAELDWREAHRAPSSLLHLLLVPASSCMPQCALAPTVAFGMVPDSGLRCERQMFPNIQRDFARPSQPTTASSHGAEPLVKSTVTLLAASRTSPGSGDFQFAFNFLCYIAIFLCSIISNSPSQTQYFLPSPVR